MVKKTVTHVSCAIKFMGKQRICVDIRQVHTLGLPRCNARNVKKTFERADNRKRHKCKLYQETRYSPDSNEASLNDVTNEKTTDKALVNMFPDEAFSIDEPPVKKRKYFKCSVKSDQHKDLENEELTESDPEVKDFMQEYWGSIRSFTKKGKVQNIYNIFYDRDFKDLVETIAERIMTHQKNRFKINYSLAYILKNIQTEELRYYHSSYNNAQMLDTALLISNRKDLMDFLNALAKESFYDGLSRPDTKWKIVQISNITFYANNLKDALLGARMTFPDYIKNNRGLLNVSGDNNLHFF